MNIINLIQNFKYKKIFLAFLISFLTYVIFFGKFLLNDFYFWDSDAQYFYIPSRVYFYEKIVENGTFPFWTERILSGFPIYADAENGYLNPINALSILIFGPTLSYKVLHIVFYLVGSLSLFFLLQRKNFNILSFFIANLIYFFNIFMINHQIHFNIILTFYLLPAAIILVELYLEKPKIKFIVLQSIIISFSILYGHIQSSLIFSLGVGLYFIVFAGKRFFSKYTLLYLGFLSVAILIQIMPQVLPSKELFEVSERSAEVNMYQGSMYPNMFTFILYPYLFGEQKEYIGKEIKSGFTYTEIYMYLGFTTFVLFTISMLFLKNNKITIYCFLTLLLFLIFFSLEYNKIFDKNTPIVSLFRHWERTVVLFSFGISLAVANLISNLKELSLKGILYRAGYLIFPCLFLLYYYKTTPFSASYWAVRDIISLNTLTSNKYFYLLMSLLIIILILFTVLYILINLEKNKYIITIQILLCLIVFGDLFYFSKNVNNFRLKNISNYEVPNFPNETSKERTFYLMHPVYGLEYLYLKSWSPLGYSQFLEDEYRDITKDLGFFTIMSLHKFDRLPSTQAVNYFGVTNAKTLNFEKKTNTLTTFPYQGLDLVKNSNNSRYIIKEEGHLKFEVESSKDQLVTVLLKHNPNWLVKINNSEIQYSKKDIFIELMVPSGKNTVEIIYTPKPFYLGLILSLFLLILFIIMTYFAKRFRYF